MSATVPTEAALPSVEEIEAAIVALEDVDKTADSFCVRLEAAIRDAESSRRLSSNGRSTATTRF